MPAPDAPLEGLKRSMEGAVVVPRGGYSYIVSPLTDGIPFMEAEVLEEVIDRMVEIADLDCDRLVAPEAMGIPLVVPLSLHTGIPYVVVRKRSYGLPGEVSVCQVTGYSTCQMYINGLREGDRVVLVDDILSTGGTLRSIVTALRSMGVEVVDTVVVLEKGDGRAALERELGMCIKTLLRVDVLGGRVVTSAPRPRISVP
ncbi:MAG: adenine phosphoribosyltransferase [Methanomassiliicoccus sp.]|nr:adenine phosphoribosyltransferase [Methanomassiliicoccus sp.]